MTESAIKAQQPLGQQHEMDIIKFILRFGYGTRPGPFLILHGAYTKYTKLTNMRYINNCDGIDCIIPVTVFLVMLFNACCTYQKDKALLMLVTALDQLDLGSTLEDETFMNTISKYITLQQIILISNNLFDSNFQLFLNYTNYLYFK